MVLEVLDTESELVGTDVPAIGVGRRKMGEHPRAVDALPQEAVVGEDVVLVPGQLLGEEPSNAAALHDLGERRGIAEDIGQPHVLGLDAELLPMELLAVEDLADERFARGDVAVGLDPHAAGRLEPALGDPRLHPIPQIGIVVTHPGQVLCL